MPHPCWCPSSRSCPSPLLPRELRPNHQNPTSISLLWRQRSPSVMEEFPEEPMRWCWVSSSLAESEGSSGAVMGVQRCHAMGQGEAGCPWKRVWPCPWSALFSQGLPAPGLGKWVPLGALCPWSSPGRESNSTLCFCWPSLGLTPSGQARWLCRQSSGLQASCWI